MEENLLLLLGHCHSLFCLLFCNDAGDMGKYLQEILNLIDTFSNYVVWYAYTFFMGQYVLSTELPWYYLFVNIGIMTPIFYLLMFFCGAGALAARGVKGVMHRHGPRKPTGTISAWR